mgnify:CR=1 FL=1
MKKNNNKIKKQIEALENEYFVMRQLITIKKTKKYYRRS